MFFATLDDVVSPYREAAERARERKGSSPRPEPTSALELIALMWLVAISLALVGNSLHH